jgi:bisphosphoglycerate-independent phosphoglycerate mutase (AlkP superfamily)
VNTYALDNSRYRYNDIDDDTLFFFNYRSDRMREIVSVFGTDPKPMEVSIPKNLVGLPLPSTFER